MLRSDEELRLRGTDRRPAVPDLRRGARSRFVGAAFRGPGQGRPVAIGYATGSGATAVAGGSVGCRSIVDPGGIPVTVVAGPTNSPRCPPQPPRPSTSVMIWCAPTRPNAHPTNRSRQRLGHVVSRPPSTSGAELVSREPGADRQRLPVLLRPAQRGPTMSFIRCDRGITPADHHTLAMALGPANRYVHSAYQVGDLDTMAAGGEYLTTAATGRGASAATSRAASSSTTGATPTGSSSSTSPTATCSTTIGAGWAPFTASGLAQWGPPATQGLPRHQPQTSPRNAIDGQRPARRQRIRPPPPRGLLKVATS